VFFLVIGEARIAFRERVASQGEAAVLALLLKASLPLLCRAPLLREAELVSLLALSGALFLTSRLRFLALSALILALWLKTLALGAGSESDAKSTTLLTHKRCFSLCPA